MWSTKKVLWDWSELDIDRMRQEGKLTVFEASDSTLNKKRVQLQKDRKTDRQTNRAMVRQKDRQTERQTNRAMERRKDIQTDKRLER